MTLPLLPAAAPATRRFVRIGAIGALAVALSGCQMFERLSRVGEAPELSPIENPVEKPDYKPVSMPMPAPQVATRHANSLWRPGARAFFKDNRAQTIGDLITIVVKFDNEEADFTNTTSRGRTNSEDLDAPLLLGWEETLFNLLANRGTNIQNPTGDANGNWFSTGRTSSINNTGTIDRQESVNFRVAGVVTQVLPNGNLVLFGRQELRVNTEVREIAIGGVIRPEDISPANTINIRQIAEARVAYGGRGTLSDIQAPSYGSEILDIVLPF